MEADPLDYQVFALAFKQEGAISYFVEHLPIEYVGLTEGKIGLQEFYATLTDFYKRTGLDPIDSVAFRSWLESESDIYDALGGAAHVSLFIDNIVQMVDISTPESVTTVLRHKAHKRFQMDSLQELHLILSRKDIKTDEDTKRIGYLTERIKSLENELGYDPFARVTTGLQMADHVETLWELPDFMPTQFPDLNEALAYDRVHGGLCRGCVYGVLALSGKGKPVSVESRISMGDGQWKKLKEIKVGDEVITHKGRPKRVLNIYEQGLLPTIRLRTYSGRTLVCALDHPVLTDGGWKEAKDVRTNDSLFTFLSNDYSYSDSITNEEARLLGYFIGDGCTGRKGVTCCDPEYQAPDMIRCGQSLGLDVHLADSNRGIYDFRAIKAGRLIKESYPDPYGLTHREREVLTLLCAGYTRKDVSKIMNYDVYSSISTHLSNISRKMEISPKRTVNQYYDYLPQVIEKARLEDISAEDMASLVVYYSERASIRLWLTRYGIYNETSHTKLLPPELFSSSLETIANFIGAYFATDGTTTKPWRIDRAPKGKIPFELSFSSVNRLLLEQVQHLLGRFGFYSKLELKNGIYQGRPHVSWRLKIMGGIKEGVRFLNTFPLYTQKRLGLEALLKVVGPQFNTLPLPPMGFAADRVVAIEDGKEELCRCLQVEGDHTFIAEDLIVHNSSFAKSLMNHWVDTGFSCLYVNFEEAQAHWERILFTQITKQNVYRSREMPAAEKEKHSRSFIETMDRWGDRFMVRHDPDTPYFEDLEKWLRDILIHSDKVPDIVIVDTIQSMFIKAAGGRPRWGQYEEMVVKLEKLAKDMNCVLIITAQENNNRLKDRREVVDQSDVGGSVTIAQKATATIFITEKKLASGDDSEDENIMQLQIPKNRITGTTFMSNPPMVRYDDETKTYYPFTIPTTSDYIQINTDKF